MSTTRTDDLRVTGKLTRVELNDAKKIIRPRMYWPRLILRNFHGFTLLIAIIWATVAGIASGRAANWQTLGIVWAVIGVIVGWSIYSVTRASKREFTTLNAGRPEWITIASEGLRFEGPGGSTAFQPWANFERLRKGREVLILDRALGHSFVIVPVGKLPPLERHRIVQVLESLIL